MADDFESPPKRPRKSRKPRKDSSEYDLSVEELSSTEDPSFMLDETMPTPKTSRKRKALAEDQIKDTYSPLHFKNDITSGYMPYIPGRWTPQSLYRLPTDVILDTIRKNGSEGIGRAELGHGIGYDATVKTGGRRVTNHIVNVCNEHPDHIGQFQKMNGKVRTIRYYWKESEQPEKFESLLRNFETLTGRPCPFKIGEVIKFPEKKLNTLRISDVTLKRLNLIMQLIGEHRVIVTINRILKMISELEQADGYKFQIDKRSAMKCLYALRSKKFVNVWETTVRSDNVDYQVQVIGHGDIEKSDDPEVFQAISGILDEFHREGRVFPHGQLRTLKKPREDLPVESKVSEFDSMKVEEIDEDLVKTRTLNDRYQFYRMQTFRNSFTGKNVKEEEGDEKLDMDETLEEGAEEEANQAMVDLFSKNPATSGPMKRGNQYYFGRDSVGYQSKSIRLFVIHEMAYHFVYGHKDFGDPHASVFNIFPPTKAFSSWPVAEMNEPDVFYDEESPYRFMPYQPKYADVAQGWFMVQDFLAALPLSIFVLASYVPKTIDRAMLMTYLEDPIRRHICIGHLPTEIREVLMKEKKVHKMLEHAFFFLGAMGLVAHGLNPNPKRFPSAANSLFFLAKRAEIFDTSKSSKGYACVNPPIESGFYPRYEYEFHSKEDIITFWNHTRAIVQSTPLSYRLEDIGEDQKSASRHKQYSIGVFDKKIVEIQFGEESERLCPKTQRDGVAGFDSALFLHLKRHWEVHNSPHSVVSWFVFAFRKATNSVKAAIEQKVQVIQKDWNSFVKLTINDNEPKGIGILKVDYPRKMKRPSANATKEKNGPRAPKKRKPDIVDIASNSSRISVRCRFSPKERDQLIMIRAVGFFLNPVYRFWLDPTVLRDLMHEFVPESRTKTVQSLMACGVRELVRSNRLAYLQRVVRNLSTFPEMIRLRKKLCSGPVSSCASKTEFFKSAFRTAMRLLFVDNDRIPPTSITDNNFNRFLDDTRVSVTKETTVSNSLPKRSQTPTTVEHIQHCVTANVLLSVLVHSQNNLSSEKLLEQVPPVMLQTVLQCLKTDGLVSRSRNADVISEMNSKNLATLSYYFRHFFAHRFHSDLIEGSGRLMEEIDEETASSTFELAGDLPEVVVAAASTFYGKRYTLDMKVDDDVLDAFSLVDKDQTIKKIRYLESANLHFEKVHVLMDKMGEEVEERLDQQPMELTLGNVEAFLDTSREVREQPEEFDEWILSVPDFQERQIMRNLMQVIKSAGPAGFTFLEILEKSELENIVEPLAKLHDSQLILSCGVDEQRYVSSEHEGVWTVVLNGRRWCPRYWISPEGAISLPVVRWMAESVLLLIVGKPGVQLKDVLFNYEFAVQPIAIRELVQLLEALKCVTVHEKTFINPKLSSPFAAPETTKSVKYVHPTMDSLERFSRIFHNVGVLPSMVKISS